MKRGTHLIAAALALLSLGWLNSERDRVAEGNRLYAAGKYDEATQRYGEALVDDPESPRLNFNMGTARYKSGKFDEALAAFERVRPAGDDPKREARTAYNAGNSHYRRGADLAATQPQEALAAYALALASYRRALGIDPADADAKFNYEFVTRKLAELRKQLEEQKKKQQEQQDQEQQQEQQPQEQAAPDEQQQSDGQPPERQPGEPPNQTPQEQTGDQQAADNPESAPPQDGESAQEPGEESAAPEPQPVEESSRGEDAAAQGEAEAAESDGSSQNGGAATAAGDGQEISRAEAAALLDAARSDELRPEDIARRMQGAAVAEPRQDW